MSCRMEQPDVNIVPVPPFFSTTTQWADPTSNTASSGKTPSQIYMEHLQYVLCDQVKMVLYFLTVYLWRFTTTSRTGEGLYASLYVLSTREICFSFNTSAVFILLPLILGFICISTFSIKCNIFVFDCLDQRFSNCGCTTAPSSGAQGVFEIRIQLLKI